VEGSRPSLLYDVPRHCPAGAGTGTRAVLYNSGCCHRLVTTEAGVQSQCSPYGIYGQWGSGVRSSGFPIPPMLHIHLSSGAGTVGVLEAVDALD
jgi:hypothetical protein